MRKLMVFLAMTATLLVLLAGGCAKAKAADSDTLPPGGCMPALEGQSLADTSWLLVSYGNPTALKTVITGTKVTLKFNADTTQISGNGSINGYGGDVVRTDNQLKLGNIMSTLMASTDQAINEQESTYFALLNAAQSVSFGEGTLTINCAGGVLNFSAA